MICGNVDVKKVLVVVKSGYVLSDQGKIFSGWDMNCTPAGTSMALRREINEMRKLAPNTIPYDLSILRRDADTLVCRAKATLFDSRNPNLNSIIGRFVNHVVL